MNFLPITLAVEQEIIKSHMDGVLSHFSGVLIAQLSIFIVYSVYRKVCIQKILFLDFKFRTNQICTLQQSFQR